MNSDYKSKIDTANELTSHLPIEIRKEAFSVMLKHLLGDTTEKGQQETSSQQNSDLDTSSNSHLKDWQQKVISSLPEPYLIAEKANREQQVVWGVITLFARKESPTQIKIRELIRNELGIAPASDANTSTKLKKLTPKYLTRNREGKGFVYSPTINSIKIFEGLASND